MAKLVMERADIIPVLGEVFRRYGYDGASLALITENTKLGKGSLYHFFPGGKEEMVKAVLADIEDWFEIHVFQPLQQNKSRERQTIDAMFSSVDTYFKSGRRVCLVGALALVETRDRFSEEVNGYFKRWISVLAEALERFGFAQADAQQTATSVVAGIQGAIVIAQALDNGESFSTVLSQLHQLTHLSEQPA